VKENNRNQKISIPALSDFTVTSVNAVQSPDQCIEVVFSDPVNSTLDLRGNITLDGEDFLKTSIDANILKVYPQRLLSGEVLLRLSPSIKSAGGYDLKGNMTFTLGFGKAEPSVRLLGKGTIVPQGKGLMFPFEAIYLNAVDLRITQIFSNNIHSFLQDNDFDGNWRLNHVGRVIKRAKIDLAQRGVSNLGQWNAFSIDLASLITIEPGAMYNVEIGFRMSYAITECPKTEAVDEYYVPIEEEENQPERSYESVYYNYYINWEEDGNPCNQAYYSPYKFVKRNIFGSNLGMIAKTDQGNNTYVYLTSLLTAKPEAGAEISFYDFQNQLLAKGNTNSEGMLSVNTPRPPFLVVAKKDKQTGYLKIDNGTALPLSSFDISGHTVEKGIKGFFFAERDVWRPGDSVYVSFILDDPESRLPQGHPLVLEIRNSRGQVVKKMVKNRNQAQIYPFYFNTSPDDPTGNWHLRMKIGALEFSRQVRIETVKPNRLKIDFEFSDEILSSGKINRGQLGARWLHGATAKNLKARVDVSFTTLTPSFAKWKDYDFSTPYNNFQGSEMTLFDGPLNDEGKTNLSLDYTAKSPVAGFLKASFLTKVFEPGGDFSIHTTSRPFSPHPDYVGLKINWSYKNWSKLNSDETHTIGVACVDAKGNPIDPGKVKISLFELDYRWWYHSNHENLASYAGQTYHKPVLSKFISTSNGKGQFTIDADENRWGRHLLLATSPNGHVCGQVIYFGYSWGREKPRSDAQMLALLTDKEKYLTGEDITISFPANKEARALLTFESGSKIIGQQWLDKLSDLTSYTFKATPEMTPNIYVHVTLIQPHGQTANDLPIRLFGIAPVLVENPGSHLKPVIQLPEEVRPQKKFTLKVSEENKQPMEYTIALVDEGLLDLTNFKTPDPWNHFYAREALGISTFDLYNFVMGAWSGRLESLFAIGGSDVAPDPSKKKADRFPPVVKVMGPFFLPANRKASHEITLPQYVGSVRAMVVAASKEKYGHAEKILPVREPLMVLATLPRVLSPGEGVDLPVTVFAMKENLKQVKVKIETNELLSVSGLNEKSLTFESPGEKEVLFSIRSLEKQGVARIKVEVSSGNEKSFHEMELNIRLPNLPHSESENFILDPGRKWNQTLNAIGIEGTNFAKIEITPFPPLNLGNRLGYLIAYPHGCIEQTTSAAFPQLYLTKLMEVKKEDQEQIKQHIIAAIEKLARHQTQEGGYSYWPGSDWVNEWSSCYAGHFLIEAEKAGYLVPSNHKKLLINYLRKETGNYVHGKYRYQAGIQVYRLYLMALAGEPQVAAMNRIRDASGLRNQDRWMLAGAYALSGMKEAAQSLIDFRNMNPDQPESETFGSYLRDEALMLQALLALGQKEQAAKLAFRISDQLSKANWYSTQSTAFALISLSQFVINSENQEVKYKALVNGRSLDVPRKKALYSNEFNFEQGKPITIEIENNGNSTLYINTYNQGVKAGVDANEAQENLQLTLKYLDKNGQGVLPSNLKQGFDFIAVVTVMNKTGLGVKNIALSQLFPAGWEIINSRLFENTQSGQNTFDYQDIRDDRVYTYFSLDAYKSKTFTVHLNSTYTGEYILSPVTCEAMYDHSYFAKIPGMMVKVIRE